MKRFIVNAVLLFLIVILLVSVVFSALTIARADTLFVCCVHKGEYVWVRDIPDIRSHNYEQRPYRLGRCELYRAAYCRGDLGSQL